MRATGVNPRMAEAQGIRVGAVTCLGMALSNALVALAGALFAQANGFADVTLGTGTIVVGLAAVIIGETLLPRPTVLAAVVGCLLGSVFYRIVVAFALEADFLGLRVLRPQPGHGAPGRRRVDPAGDRARSCWPGWRRRDDRAQGRGGRVPRRARSWRRGPCAGSTSPSRKASSSPSSAATGPASRRCSTCWPAPCAPRRAGSPSTAPTSRRRRAAARARLLARVFQDPLGGTCAALTIEENLALAEARGRGRGLALAVADGGRARWRRAAGAISASGWKAGSATGWACCRAGSGRRWRC